MIDERQIYKLEMALVFIVLLLFTLLIVFYYNLAFNYCKLYCEAKNMNVSSFGWTGSCGCSLPPQYLQKYLIHAGEWFKINITVKNVANIRTG